MTTLRFIPEVLTKMKYVIGVSATLSDENLMILNSFVDTSKPFRLINLSNLVEASTSRFTQCLTYTPNQWTQKHSTIRKEIERVLKQGSCYIIVVDDSHHEYKTLPTQSIDRLRGKVSEFFDWDGELCAEISQQVIELKEKTKPWLVYTNQRGMIGVDFCFPESAHVICALNLETIADHDQVLGRGTRKAGTSTTGSLIVPED